MMPWHPSAVSLGCAWLSTVTWAVVVAVTTTNAAEEPFVAHPTLIAIALTSLVILPMLPNAIAALSPTLQLLLLPSALGGAYALYPERLTPLNPLTQWPGLVGAHIFTAVAIACAIGIARPKCRVHEILDVDAREAQSAPGSRDIFWLVVHVCLFVIFGLPFLLCVGPSGRVAVLEWTIGRNYGPLTSMLAIGCVAPAAIQTNCVRCPARPRGPLSWTSSIQAGLLVALGLGCISFSYLTIQASYSAWVVKHSW